MRTHNLQTPLTDQDVLKLHSGDVVLLSGVLYTARDAAHKKLIQTLDQGLELPFDLQGAVIYYVGPTPAPPGRPIGSAGPTTSYRMDAYAPRLHAQGLKASIGKGKRGQEVKKALQEYCAVYLGATGGAGALLSQRVLQAEVLAYPELGPEAVHKLKVQDFPTLVVNDAYGGELYAEPRMPA